LGLLAHIFAHIDTAPGIHCLSKRSQENTELVGGHAIDIHPHGVATIPRAGALDRNEQILAGDFQFPGFGGGGLGNVASYEHGAEYGEDETGRGDVLHFGFIRGWLRLIK
jgi:hypothetical protein